MHAQPHLVALYASGPFYSLAQSAERPSGQGHMCSLAWDLVRGWFGIYPSNLLLAPPSMHIQPSHVFITAIVCILHSLLSATTKASTSPSMDPLALGDPFEQSEARNGLSMYKAYSFNILLFFMSYAQ